MDIVVRKYNDEGDLSRGTRTLTWMGEYVFSPLLDEYWNEGESVLDVGSGNGRVNSLLKDYFEEIYNIDLVLETDEKFKYDNVVSYKADVMTFEFNRKFDTIFMFATFRLFINKYLAMKKFVELMNPYGQIVIIEDPNWVKHKNKSLAYNLHEIAPPFGLYIDEFITKKADMKISFMRRKSEYRETKITKGDIFRSVEKNIGLHENENWEFIDEQITMLGTDFNYEVKRL